MATVNLGAIKFNWKGAYNNSTAYVVDDVVSSSGSSYVCILASQGNAVSNGTYWNIMSSAGTNGTNGTDLTSTLTAQGDILYRDGSGLAKLGAGTSGQVLQTGGTGANPSWADASSGKILNIYYKNFTGVITSAGTYTWYDVTNLTQTLTPVSVNSKFLIHYRVSMGTDGNHTYARLNCGGTTPYLADAYSSAFRSASTVAAKAVWDMDELTGTYLWDANTASSTTIKVQYANEGNGYVNRGERDNGQQSDARATSDLTIWEIDS